MEKPSVKRQSREWLFLTAAVFAGPAFVACVNAGHMVYGVAGGFYFVFCATIIPLLTYGAGRFKFLAWQIAVISLVVSGTWDGSSGGFQVHGRELFTWLYFSSFFAELLSAPLPLYYRLAALPKRRRYIEGAIFAGLAVVLFGGLALLGR